LPATSDDKEIVSRTALTTESLVFISFFSFLYRKDRKRFHGYRKRKRHTERERERERVERKKEERMSHMSSHMRLGKAHTSKSFRCFSARTSRQDVRMNQPGFDLGGANHDRRKLILPGEKVKGPSKGAGPGIVGFVQEGDGAEGRNKFTLPKNFMDRTPGQAAEEDANAYSIDDMLTILTERTDQWHRLADFILMLKKEGVGSEIIDEVAGINALEQNLWIVSSNVYRTLEDRNVREDVLSYFSTPDAEKLLYPLRVMTAEDRQVCAEYLYEQQLDEKQSEMLIRAMREHARRRHENDQFEYTPGDCLAFKYYRDALEETRNKESKAEIVHKGLERAESDQAREALEELLVEKDEEDESKARITVVELDEDEYDNCILSIAGELNDIGVKQLADASMTNRKGAFGILTSQKAGEDWVVVPMFQPFVSAIDLVAIAVDDMTQLKDYGAVSGGTGVLVVDRAVHKSHIDTGSLYAITFDNKDLSFVSGQELLNQVEIVGEDKVTVVCKAIMAVKPPSKKEDFGDAVAVVDNLN
jgi:hypothetical protein